MSKQVLVTMIGLFTSFLVGCNQGVTSSTQAENKRTSPHGNGSVIVGSVVRVTDDGSLVTNIPLLWLAAERTDENPIPSNPDCLPEGQSLEITIAGRKFPGLWACIGLNAVKEGEWCVLPATGWIGGLLPDSSMSSMIVIVCKERNAASASGASVGQEIRLTKVERKY